LGVQRSQYWESKTIVFAVDYLNKRSLLFH